jgi:predicted extracellular nuclease
MLRRSLARLTPAFLLLLAATGAAAQGVFINEIHYDNAGTDSGEAIEIAGPAGTSLGGWSVVLYNGNGGSAYNSLMLSGTLADDTGTGFGFTVLALPTNGLQNGAPDGIALVNGSGSVVQFLSYEGSFTAVGGPADGLSSTDIAVSESSSTQIGESLQLVGSGSTYTDFSWDGPAADSFGSANAGQSFGGSGPPPAGTTTFINEIHYDNSGTDVGEAIEIAGPAGTDLTDWQIVLYNGSNGTAYRTTTLNGAIPPVDGSFGFVVIDYPTNGIQNGSPDGIALVDASGAAVQFLSYEGSFTAVGGPADGLSSTDIGIVESSGTAVGSSLQLTGSGSVYEDFVWTAAPQTFCGTNSGQVLGSGGGGSCAPLAPTPIYDIQGSGAVSPLEGEAVLTEGVVTGDFQDGGAGTNGDLNGFYIQSVPGDGDPATSDGIFVFDGFGPSVDVAVGDAVRVSGTVAEFFGETQINALGGSVEIVGSGNPLPLTTLTLPAAATILNSNGRPIADLEYLEGMRVLVEGYVEVTELFQLDRFGELELAAGGRFTQYTQTSVPSVVGLAAHVDDLARRTLVLDDGLTVQNPDPIRYPAPALDTGNTVRMGDIATNLVGNIRYSRGSGGSGDENYRLEPVEEPIFTATNLRPAIAPDAGGRLRIASVNVLNYFTTLGSRGASNDFEFARQQEKLVTALAGTRADVLGLVELENNYADGEDSAAASLVAALNAGGTACAGGYDYVRSPDSGPIGDDEIAVGILYCRSTVGLAPEASVEILDDSDLPALGLSGPVFDGEDTNRAALAVSFVEIATGERFTVVANHFKSKGGSPGPICATPSADPNCDQSDGAGAWDARRVAAAEALIAWLATDPTGVGDTDVAILGDLNAYALENPLLAFDAAGYANPVADLSRSYTFVFDGQAGSLDYALVSPSLASAVTGIAEWRISADEPDALDYNTDFGRNPALFDGNVPYRASDHDPVLLGVELADTIPPVVACNSPATIRVRDRNLSFTATASDAIDPAPTVEILGYACIRTLPSGTAMNDPSCRVTMTDDGVSIAFPGGANKDISWTVLATDAAGNSAESVCSVAVQGQ